MPAKEIALTWIVWTCSVWWIRHPSVKTKLMIFRGACISHDILSWILYVNKILSIWWATHYGTCTKVGGVKVQAFTNLNFWIHHSSFFIHDIHYMYIEYIYCVHGSHISQWTRISNNGVTVLGCTHPCYTLTCYITYIQTCSHSSSPVKPCIIHKDRHSNIIIICTYTSLLHWEWLHVSFVNKRATLLTGCIHTHK